MNDDYELFDICNKHNEFEHLDARFYNAYQLKIITSDEKYEIKAFLSKVSNSRGESLDSTYNTLEDDIKVSDEMKDIQDSINDNIKKDYVQDIDDDIDLLTLKQIKDTMDGDDEGIDEEQEYLKTQGFSKKDDSIDVSKEYGSINEDDLETGEGFEESEYEQYEY